MNTGRTILTSLLAKSNRSLTNYQEDVVLKAFSKCPTPLFLKLEVDEAKLWRSYSPIKDTVLPFSTTELINRFFDNLEKKHSFTFVSKSIGYIVAAKNGLMETELDDLLSLDDEVLDNAYQYWPPPNKNSVRVPGLLWARMRHDLGENLVERQSNGKTVLAFYHRQFVEVARKRYLNEDRKKNIHSALSLYFLGTYAEGKKKTLTLKIWGNDSVAVDRKVASQPLKISKGVYNHRLLDELPFHLLHASGADKNLLNSFSGRVLCEYVLFNVKWIETKIKAFSIKGFFLVHYFLNKCHNINNNSRCFERF